MSTKRFTTLYRAIFILAAFALLGFALPQQVFAASPFITISGVKADQTVTVHATGLPAGYAFVAKMDVGSSQATEGVVVGQSVAGSDGIFDATYAIPSQLHGKSTISIRIDSTRGGYYAYNWFTNRTQGTSGTVSTPVPTIPVVTTTPNNVPQRMYVKVVAVEKNERITVSASGFPLNTDFKVRVGPFYTFASNQATVARVNSGKTGNFLFNVDLPDIVKDVELVTIRMDSAAKRYSYNLFTNKDLGTVSDTPSNTVTPTPTATPTGTPVISGSCQVISVTPTNSLSKSEDFDAIWTVKNISNRTWNEHEIDFRYLDGTKMHKFSQPYDLPAAVKPGETVKLLVDMLAPDKTGTYTTQFELVGDTGRLCALKLEVTVR